MSNESHGARDPQLELHQMAAIGQLGVAIAHEINSPVGSLLSNNMVLRRCVDELQELLADPKAESRERAAHLLEICRRLTDVDRIACERIQILVRGIKRFSRVAEGDPQLTDLNRELRETLNLAACQFQSRIQCDLQLGELPHLPVFPQRLNQVFLNLLVNSAQAIESAGKISVKTEQEGDAVHISFTDNGKGMTPEQKARVFQAGFTTKAPGEGTGLGLSLSREIVEKEHGGSIDFESEAGVGTTFHIRLPLAGANQDDSKQQNYSERKDGGEREQSLHHHSGR
jgi:two-component system, NtrC family, sensor kinase